MIWAALVNSGPTDEIPSGMADFTIFDPSGRGSVGLDSHRICLDLQDASCMMLAAAD
jgi:hypothetical protein